MTKRQPPAANDGRREPRYAVNTRQGKVQVTIERENGSGTENIDAELLDISHKGAKFCMAEGLPFAESVKLHFEVPDLGMRFDVSGTVCWSRVASKNSCFVGFTLAPEITDETLTEMASCGCIERRSSTRIPISCPAAASWELDPTEVAVEVVDYSTGGFCLVAKQAGEVGQRMLLHLTRPDELRVSIAAQIKWRRDLENDCLVGCALTNSKDAQHLRRVGASHELSPPFLYLSRVAKERVGYLLTAVALAAVSTVSFAWLSGASQGPPEEPLAKLQPTPLSIESEVIVETLTSTAAHPSDASLDHLENTVSSPATPNAPDTIDVHASVVASEPSESSSDPSAPIASKLGDHTATSSHDSTTPDRSHGSVSDVGLDEGLGTARPAQAILSSPPMEPPNKSSTPAKITAELPQAVSPDPERVNRDRRRADTKSTDGGRLYRRGQYELAVKEFRAAALLDRSNPRHYYLLALALYQTHRTDVALRSVKRGVELESRRPLRDWGTLMSRYQGPARLWLEQVRTKYQRDIAL